jgi:outer membrane lipoprotein-sorting protein
MNRNFNAPGASRMRLRRIAAITAALAFGSLLSAPTAPASPEPVQSLTIAQVLARAYTARGGLVKLRALQGQRITGTISFGNDASGPFSVEFRRPLKMHMELMVQNQNVVRIYDGKDGWANNPFVGKANPEPMSEEDLKNINEEADFEGPLVDYRKKGNKVELVGKDKVEDKDVWRVKMTTKTGDIRYYLFDATTFLLLKWEGKRQVQGKEIPMQSYFRDYREVGGMKFAFAIDSGSSATDLTQKIIIEKIELNPQVPESEFVKPAVPGETALPASPSH